MLKTIILSIIRMFVYETYPCLFGSVYRRKAFEEQSKKYKSLLRKERAKDPLATASAKQALAQTSRYAKQAQQRMMNRLGGAGTSAEALVASQGAVSKGVGEAMGQIASAGEAQKQQQINMLQQQQLGAETRGIQEKGKGWKDFFEYVGPVIGSAMEAGSKVATGGIA